MTILVNVYLQFLMDSFPQDRLSQLIIKLRGTRSQRNFAKTLNVSYATIRSWEEGESLPGLPSLQKLADYTDQTIEELLDYLKGGEDKSKVNNSFEPVVAEDLLPQIKSLSAKEKSRLTEFMLKTQNFPEEDIVKFSKLLIKKKPLSVKKIGQLTQMLVHKLVNDN